MAQNLEDSKDIRHTLSTVIEVVRRRRWALIIPGCLAAFCALLVTFTYPRIFVAKTMFERRDSIVIANLISVYQRNPISFANVRKSIYVDIKGYKAVERAVEQLGLYKGLPRDANGDLTSEGRQAKQAMINQIASDCEIYLSDSTDTMDLIRMSLSSKDPAAARAILTALRDNYIQSIQERITQMLENAQAYFKKEADQLREIVSQHEADMVKFRSQFSGADPADPESIVHRLTALTVQREDLKRRAQELEMEIRLNEDYLGKNTPTTSKPASSQPRVATVRVEPPPTRPNPARAEVQRRIDALVALIAERKMAMTEEHPEVRRLRMKLAQAEHELSRTPPLIPVDVAPTVAAAAPSSPDTEGQARRFEQLRLEVAQRNLQQQLAKTRHDLELVERQIARYEAEKGAIFERRQEYLRRQEQLSSAMASFKQEMKRYDGVTEILKAEQNKRGVSFKVLEETQVSPKPVSPTMSRLTTMSLGFGSAVGLACAVLLELLDRTFRAPSQINSILQLPVLQCIGEFVSPGMKRRRLAKRVALHLVATVLILLVCATSGLVYLSLEKPHLYERLKMNPEAMTLRVMGIAP